MRVLVDECAPKALKRYLVGRGHDALTVQEAGWAGKRNGDLLRLADRIFQVFATTDTNIPFQQNLNPWRIAIVVIHSQSNRMPELQRYFPACAEAITNIQPSDVVHVGVSQR